MMILFKNKGLGRQSKCDVAVVLEIIFGKSHHHQDNIHPAYVLLNKKLLSWRALARINICSLSYHRRSKAYAFCYCWIMEYGWTHWMWGEDTREGGSVEVERHHNNKPWNCLKIKFSLIELHLHKCKITLQFPRFIAALTMARVDKMRSKLSFNTFFYYLISFSSALTSLPLLASLQHDDYSCVLEMHSISRSKKL